MKLTFKPVAELIKTRNADPGISGEMWDIIFDNPVVEASLDGEGDIILDKDEVGYTWDSNMFVEGSRINKQKVLELDEAIDGNETATINFDGSVTVGCQTVSAAQLKSLYDASRKALTPRKRKKKK